MLPRDALALGGALSAAGVVYLTIACNALSAVLAAATIGVEDDAATVGGKRGCLDLITVALVEHERMPGRSVPYADRPVA